jgi:hypothetical protein
MVVTMVKRMEVFQTEWVLVVAPEGRVDVECIVAYLRG